jgi:hypothetical protein
VIQVTCLKRIIADAVQPHSNIHTEFPECKSGASKHSIRGSATPNCTNCARICARPTAEISRGAKSLQTGQNVATKRNRRRAAVTKIRLVQAPKCKESPRALRPQLYEIRPRKDHRDVDLISDALPGWFSRYQMRFTHACNARICSNLIGFIFN